ncbi:MAG: conserved rane protein of unknown function [Chlamydiales bacterium]|jgi:hypothetical protein|nr:conserved rane protein of unknown function [Chlamydiales bacterium]
MHGSLKPLIIDDFGEHHAFKAALFSSEDTIVDTKRGAQCSFWQWPWRLIETNRIRKFAKKYFKEELRSLHPDLPNSLEKYLIKHALIKAEISPFKPLKVKNLQNSFSFLQEEVHCKGASLNLCFENGEGATIVQKMLHYLFTDEKQMPHLLEKPLLYALFIQQDDTLLNDMREELKCLFLRMIDMADLLQGDQEKLFKIFLGHALSLYSYSHPQDLETILLPQCIDGKWLPVEYTIQTLQLTPASLGAPYTAYGLMPNDLEIGASPILLYMGTTYPGAKGALFTYLADFTPGKSVGEGLIEMGSQKLEKWLSRALEKTKVPADVYGMSLGGALSLLTEVKWPDLVGRVFSYNPPALMKKSMKSYLEKIKDRERQVFIYCQHNDPVSEVGAYWAEGWHLFKIFTQEAHHPVNAHNKIFCSQKEVWVVQIDRNFENQRWKRAILSTIHHLIALPVFMVFATLKAAQFICYYAKLTWQRIQKICPSEMI